MTWWTRPQSGCGWKSISKPEELDALDRQILQLQIEAEALEKEDDAASVDRLEQLEEELADLQDRASEMTAKWQAERDKLEGTREVKEKLDRARAELDIAKREGNLAKAGELSYGVIPDLERKLSEAESAEDMMVEEAVRPSRLRKLLNAGPVFRHPRCWKVSAINCCAWKTSLAAV